MKTIRIIVLLLILPFQLGIAQTPFNLENVKNSQETIGAALQTNQIVIAWQEAQEPTVKVDKFTLLLQEVAGPILARQWIYPSSNVWPLVDWARVSSLPNLIKDQVVVIETTHAVAQSDEEMARICILLNLIIKSGSEVEPWYENWLLSLAKSSNTNLKRLVFNISPGFAEDIGETGNTEGIRAIDWEAWETAFNQSDDLGKALLLVCMTDLALRKEEFAKVTELHIGVFNGTNDDLKAIALHSSTRKLGAAIVAKWQDIADNHANPKMKALAQEALDRGV